MSVELILPLLGAEDGLFILGVGVHLESGGGCMLDELRKIIRIDGVHHPKEIIFVHRLATIAPLVLHILPNDQIILDKLRDLLAAELIILRHVDELDLGDLEKALFVGQDLLQEIFVEVRRWRQEIL